MPKQCFVFFKAGPGEEITQFRSFVSPGTYFILRNWFGEGDWRERRSLGLFSRVFVLFFQSILTCVSHGRCSLSDKWDLSRIIHYRKKKKTSLSTVQVKLTARDGLTGKCPPTSSSQPNGISPPRLESDSQDRKYVGKGSALQGKCTKIKLDTRHNRNTGMLRTTIPKL